MRKFLSILISIIILGNSLLITSFSPVSAETTPTLTLNGKTNGTLKDGITNTYQIKVKHCGLLDIRLKTDDDYAIKATIYTSDYKSSFVLPFKYDATKQVRYLDYPIYLKQAEYYLELSYVMVKGCSYTLKTSFEDIHTVEKISSNHSLSTALKLSNNKYNIGILGFEESEDYYKIKFTKDIKLKLSITEDASLKVNILDTSGNLLYEGNVLKNKPYSLTVSNKPGTYIIKVIKSNSYTDFNSISYSLITGNYVPIKSISLPSKKILEYSTKYTFKPTIKPSKATGSYIYESSDPDVVKIIDEDKGIVFSLNEGTATVTVTTYDGNLVSSCKVTVKKN